LSSRLRGGCACGPDLIPNFRDSSGANFVEHSNYVTVHGHQARADGNFYVRIAPMKLIKARENLIIRYILVIEVDRVSLLDLDRNIILYCGWRRSNCRRQIDTNPFHVGLAQTHHHEAGEEKEHDVDQRDDLNARSFMRNR
jgi:hypothetical protein